MMYVINKPSLFAWSQNEAPLTMLYDQNKSEDKLLSFSYSFVSRAWSQDQADNEGSLMTQLIYILKIWVTSIPSLLAWSQDQALETRL